MEIISTYFKHNIVITLTYKYNKYKLATVDQKKISTKDKNIQFLFLPKSVGQFTAIMIYPNLFIRIGFDNSSWICL